MTLSSKGRGSSAPIVDGCASDADISSAFSAKLCDLNSGTSLDSCSHLQSNIENTPLCDELLTSVSADTVAEALSHLKPDKSHCKRLLI